MLEDCVLSGVAMDFFSFWFRRWSSSETYCRYLIVDGAFVPTLYFSAFKEVEQPTRVDGSLSNSSLDSSSASAECGCVTFPSLSNSPLDLSPLESSTTLELLSTTARDEPAFDLLDDTDELSRRELSTTADDASWRLEAITSTEEPAIGRTDDENDLATDQIDDTDEPSWRELSTTAGDWVDCMVRSTGPYGTARSSPIHLLGTVRNRASADSDYDSEMESE